MAGSSMLQDVFHARLDSLAKTSSTKWQIDYLYNSHIEAHAEP